jgi:hypothetical protein
MAKSLKAEGLHNQADDGAAGVEDGSVSGPASIGGDEKRNIGDVRTLASVSPPAGMAAFNRP